MQRKQREDYLAKRDIIRRKKALERIRQSLVVHKETLIDIGITADEIMVNVNIAHDNGVLKEEVEAYYHAICKHMPAV